MSHTEKDVQCREIITKAVCGKGRKFTQATHTITPAHSPTSILGCWIINHTFTSEKVGDSVEVSGSYDINVWYSFNNDTKTEVVSETVSYIDHVPLTVMDKNSLDDGIEVNARATQQPTACEATITNSGNSILIQAERDFQVEVIGETRICVILCHSCDDSEEKELDFDEEVDEELDDFEPEFIIDDLD